MQLLPLILSPVRSLLVKLHPYFSCCASCGEIKMPLNGRLCTSLSPDFPVDAVLPGGTEQEAAKLRHAMPWLRRLHTVQNASPSVLHTLPDLADNFFVTLAGANLPHIRHPLDLFTPNGIPLLAVCATASLSPAEAALCAMLEQRDCIAAREVSFVSGVYSLTRECLDGFAAFCADAPLPENAKMPDAFACLARWAYSVALAVPAGPGHPLLHIPASYA